MTFVPPQDDLGTLAAEANKTEADLKAALADYEAKINSLIVK